MRVRLQYQSGQEYSERFFGVEAKVSRDAKTVRFSFRETTDGNKGYASFALPYRKAKLLAHAILMASVEDGIEPTRFKFEEEA